MAEFAPVLPIELYPYLDTDHPDSVHFFHAPQVAKASGHALEWIYTLQGRIILDCWAWELQGQDPDVKQVIEVAKELVSLDLDVCILVPDVVKDARKSLAIVRSWGSYLHSISYNIMIVPHGKDLMEWTRCCREMIIPLRQLAGDITIGLPKYLDSLPGGRWTAAAWVAGNYPTVPMHLLGVWDHLYQVEHILRDVLNVRSVDSTRPFTCAMCSRIVDNYVCPSRATPMEEEWWDLDVRGGGPAPSTGSMEIAELNIAAWRVRLRDVGS